MTTAPRLGDGLPDFLRDVDRTSLSGQSHFTLATRYQLIALLVAAVFGAFSFQPSGSGPDWAGVVAASAFIAAALLRGYLWQSRPDREWYAGRAAAESAKTLTWRFSVGADPFPIGLPDQTTESLFIERLRDIRRRLDGVVIIPSSRRKGEITAEMTALRASPLSLRKAAYLKERIEDQLDWYSAKAEFNKLRAKRWAAFMLVIEISGVGGAVVKATRVLEVDLLGLASAVVAAAAAWNEMRQHNNLANAYSIAAGELAEALELGKRTSSEPEWSSFVANAEEAVSREHTMWVASRRQ